jgi:hypothetical protein
VGSDSGSHQKKQEAATPEGLAERMSRVCLQGVIKIGLNWEA